MAPLVRRQSVSSGKTRVPTYNYHLKQRPWQIQPFFIAPLLPGDRVKKMLWNDTCISDPLANRLIGWHCETKFFYMRVRDCFPGNEALMKSIFIDPEANLSSLYGAADVAYFHKYGVNWLKEITRSVVENYFRAEDEAPDDATIDTLWAATIGTDNWLDSAALSADIAEEDVVLTVGSDDAFGMAELEKAQRMYELLKAGSLTDMDYPDFLRTYGVNVPSEELQGKPKYLGGKSEWTMPSNTVEPTTGVATTAVYWQNKDRLDKDFFCKEPGFVVGYRIYRPKVYLGNVRGSLTGIMDTGMEWLPAIMRDDPTSSMIELTDTTGPLNGMGQNYMLDLKDLFIYGEQFVNYALTELDRNIIALPAANTTPTPDVMAKRYPSKTMAQSIFLDDAADGAKQFIECDGRIDITITGALVDTTPSVARLEV